MQKGWSEKKNDQLSDLLYEMSESLGFDFDKVHIKKAGYIPQAYADQQDETDFIRRQLVDVFLNKKSIPMAVKNHYEGKASLSIKLEPEND